MQKTHQVSFHFLDVNGGDAIHIRFLGTDGKWHNILIDGGYAKEYKNAFGPLIREIVEVGEIIDYWIVSHIDQDHIGAVLGFFKDKKIENKKEIVQNFIFNYSPEKINIPNGKISVKEGIDLRNFLKINDIPAISPINTSTESLDVFGLKITILSPNPEKEAIATELWRKKEFSGRIGRKASESDHKKNIKDLEGIKFNEDDDPINGSSIAILAEFQSIKALLLADSHPSDIIDSLDHLTYSKDAPLAVNFMQLAHHGSKGNTNPKILEIVKTKNYVVTGNGIHNRHPDKETLVRLITRENKGSEILNIYFVCDTPELRDIFGVDQNPFNNHKFNCEYSKLGVESYTLAYLPLKD
ncbi:hypothetical protein OMO38_05280 [Chryseobacterium sp. 09-1422]|uniref:Metallo-beta-lactamase domain-containing protein n=1 Tax=Chryseobacterium kimseyorum TaxID=2984028 RepID=A0ABT3HVW7_9FLAO|nr:hypothetical protein [Chryseobacterium kimseyorum]MCW3167935.1 hypothetical protein [Chryseobacterium kimseyorum]